MVGKKVQSKTSERPSVPTNEEEMFALLDSDAIDHKVSQRKTINLVTLHNAASSGMGEGEIAKACGTMRHLLHRYRVTDPIINAVYQHGRMQAMDAMTDEVERALYDNATTGMNFSAQRFWLVNKRDNEWRDKAEGSNGGIHITVNTGIDRGPDGGGLIEGEVVDD